MFWILFLYLIVAYLVPEVGVIAIICMVGPVAMAVGKGRYWCGHFCPRVHVSAACQMKCKRCAKVCPMQLVPYESRGNDSGYLHADCIKCGRCIKACPTKVMKMCN